jgi:hypothetical protein
MIITRRSFFGFLATTPLIVGATNFITVESIPVGPTIWDRIFGLKTQWQKLRPVLLSIIRRCMPLVLAKQIIGVQPMKGPTGLIYTLRDKYTLNN